MSSIVIFYVCGFYSPSTQVFLTLNYFKIDNYAYRLQLDIILNKKKCLSHLLYNNNKKKIAF